MSDFSCSGKRWTIEEEQQLQQEYSGNPDLNRLCTIHKRKIGGIVSRLQKLGLLPADFVVQVQVQVQEELHDFEYSTKDFTIQPQPELVPAPAPLSVEQQKAFNLFLSGSSFCLTGLAGTGKSHIIKHISHHCTMHGIEYAITAFTGVAACLIGGQTIHKWTGLGLMDKPLKNLVRTALEKNADEQWKSVKVLIIDEISMVNQELFEKLNLLAQNLRNSSKFFGGIQVIVCGDFAQLPPIEGSFAFESSEWLKNFNSGRTIYLKEVLRQDDPAFIKMLSEIRLGIVTLETKKLLKQKLNDSDMPVDSQIKPTELYPHRKAVDEINTTKLNQLTGESKTFIAVDTKYVFNTKTTVTATKKDTEIFDERCPASIKLAVGAQVMLTVNLNVKDGLVNGSRGVIVEFGKNGPIVLFDNLKQLEIIPKKFDTRINSGIVFRSQIPLILAWAITIHKCQGSTLTSVITDLRNVFGDAQIYVTLSRVKSLDGLHLIGIDFSKIKCNSKVKEYYEMLEAGSHYDEVLASNVDDICNPTELKLECLC